LPIFGRIKKVWGIDLLLANWGFENWTEEGVFDTWFTRTFRGRFNRFISQKTGCTKSL